MSDHGRTFNVLFLSNGNSGRSILCEALLNKRGQGRFRAFSAGSHPARRVNPYALQLLETYSYPTDGLRSKSQDEFLAPGAPEFDFVFTLGDDVCPMWPGRPIKAHWGVFDPAAVSGTDEQKWIAFDQAFRVLERRISLFCSIPICILEQLVLQEHLSEIGRS